MTLSGTCCLLARFSTVTLVFLSVLHGCERSETAGPLPSSKSTAAPSGVDLIRKVRGLYASLDSYRDQGWVSHTEGSKRPFKTAFVRSKGFRFEYAEASGQSRRNRHVVWWDGSRAETWWEESPDFSLINSGATLGDHVAGETGVSGGSIHTISALLMPDLISGRTLADVEDPVTEGDATANGRPVWVVGGIWSGARARIFIDQETLAVLRIEELHPTIRPDRILTLLEYQPEVNVEVSPEDLEKGWD